MMTLKTSFIPAAVLALMLGVASSAGAATLDFTNAGPQGGGPYTDGVLEFDDVRIVMSGGNCQSASGPECGALNKNETSILTRVGGGLFSLTSLWYDTQGTNAVLSLLTDMNFELLLQNQGGASVDLSAYAEFANLTSVTFSFTDDDGNGQGGNARFDDIGYTTPAAVPLPAAGFLLIAGLGALAAARRKKA